MRARRNWPAILGLVLGVIGVVGYFALVISENPAFTWLIRTPVINVALVVAGLMLSAFGVIIAFSPGGRGRILAPLLGVVNLAVSVFLLSHIFVDSYRLPPAARAPAVGTAAPDFELMDDRGTMLRLSSLRGRNVVLLFYRGFW
jgi:hypothetical protein